MTSWVIESLNRQWLEEAGVEASRRILTSALGLNGELQEHDQLRFMAEALELAVMDLLDDKEELPLLRQVSAQAFQLRRVLPKPKGALEAGGFCLRLACVGILADRPCDVVRYLRESPWPDLPLDSPSWGDRVLAGIYDIWLRLLRKAGWGDLDAVSNRIVALRSEQDAFEAIYLDGLKDRTEAGAWQLMALYHLAKASEILATYTEQGEVSGHFDIR